MLRFATPTGTNIRTAVPVHVTCFIFDYKFGVLFCLPVYVRTTGVINKHIVKHIVML